MKEKIKIGYIGLGRRGYGLLDWCFTEMGDVEVAYLCDVREEQFEKSLKLFRDRGLPEPVCVTDYREILADSTVDAVVVMTGWDMHVRCAVDSLLSGKYTAIEVGCAYDISECYQLIDAHEKTGAPLMMLENCCYGRREMMALRMVREGLFGEVVHCEGGYQHYLCREDLFKVMEDGRIDEKHYRLIEYVHRSAEQYPTHELGPIAKLLNINRGNRFLTISSFASKARGIKEYMKENVPDSHPLRNAEFKQGDIVTSVITCAGGETIHLTLDTTLPRHKYSRHFTVRGTRGMCEEVAGDICTFHVEGVTEEGVFNNEGEMYEKYDHPLHREYAALGERGGHGGMDWLVCRAFVESVKRGTNTPIDAYDTVSWMAVGPLSEQSVSLGGAPIAFPDFTRGKWINREESPKGKYSLTEVVEDPETPIL